MHSNHPYLDPLVKFFTGETITSLKKQLEVHKERSEQRKEKVHELLKKDRLTPVKSITRIASQNDIVIVQLKEGEDSEEYAEYIDRKYQQMTGEEPESMIIVTNSIEDVKKIDRVELKEMVGAYRVED